MEVEALTEHCGRGHPLPARSTMFLANERGAPILELCLILPVIVILLVGVTELGFQMKECQIAADAIRVAGRVAGLQPVGTAPADIAQNVVDTALENLSGSGLDHNRFQILIQPGVISSSTGSGVNTIEIVVRRTQPSQFAFFGHLLLPERDQKGVFALARDNTTAVYP